MKTSFLSLILTVSALVAFTPAAIKADTLDQMAQKITGSTNSPANGLTPLVLGAHGVVDRDNKVLISGYSGTLTVPASTISSGTSIPVTSKETITHATTIAWVPGKYSSLFTLTPSADETINVTKTNLVAGRFYTIVITTTGTTSRTITFGTNFKKTGTLATGTSDAKVFVVNFIYDGTNLCEVSRTTAM